MAGGRPTKLTKALVEKAHTYDFVELRQAVPTIEGLALYLGIHRDTLYSWCEGDGPLNREISDITKELLTQQSLELMNGALKGKLNPQISRLILSSKHGYVEKQQTDLTTNGKDLPTPILGGVSAKETDG